ncbi:MAG: 16S rRNA processing protein RimM [Clostridiales bacterium]|nr:16S rRNA processing protein RimM [Clostridiales bacterium]
MKTKDHSDLVNIGRITSAVGIKGEVRVLSYAFDSENLKEGKVLLLNRIVKDLKGNTQDSIGSKNLRIDSIRYHKNLPIISFEGVIDRNSAEELKGMELFIKAEELEKLPAGEYYVRDIIGFKVIDLVSGETVGILQDVIQNTAQNILDITGDSGKQILIPAVDVFMKKIDVDNEVIEVELIPGFI